MYINKGQFNIYVKLPTIIQYQYTLNPNMTGEQLYRIFEEYLTKGRIPLGRVPAYRKIQQHKLRNQQKIRVMLSQESAIRRKI